MKRGFTLIEMLITIVLIGVVLTLTTVSIVKIRNDMTNRLYDNKVGYIEAGAIDWGKDNLNSLNSTNCKCVSVDELISLGYITGDENKQSTLSNPLLGGNLNNKYVCVKYVETSATYNSSNVFNSDVTAEYKETTCLEN